jgi:hypothetical protein
MQPNRAFRISIFLLTAVVLTGIAHARSHRYGVKARVHFVANSTFLRSSEGQNEDAYLAELHLAKQSDAILARLIDSYPSGYPSLTHEVLTAANGTVLPVQRDEECDLPFQNISLRTAPGDLMAILPERLNYHPSLERTPAPETVLPCYRVLRK